MLTIRNIRLPLITLAAFSVLACAPSDPAPEIISESETAFAASDCRNEGPRLPLSGMCHDAAMATLNLVDGEEPLLFEGCTWKLQETAFASDILLYRSAVCSGIATSLEYAGGARTAKLYTKRGKAGSETVTDDHALITVISADPQDPLSSVQTFVRSTVEGPEQPEECAARLANLEGWPSDAIVVDLSTPPPPSMDGPRSACGRFGYDESNTAYWRVFDGFAWFFDLGQDAYQEVDPRSLTLITPTYED